MTLKKSHEFSHRPVQTSSRAAPNPGEAQRKPRGDTGGNRGSFLLQHDCLC